MSEDDKEKESLIPTTEEQIKAGFNYKLKMFFVIFLAIVLFTTVGIFYTTKIYGYKAPINLNLVMRKALEKKAANYYIISIIALILTIVIFPLFGLVPPTLWYFLNKS
jgi:magnesium-transporting ATPase (P-type)